MCIRDRYYSVIGGWVIKYLIEYVKGNSQKLATDGYFSEFISNGVSTEICFLLFALFTVAIIYAGVRLSLIHFFWKYYYHQREAQKRRKKSYRKILGLR